MNGADGSQRARGGRPKKKPGYCREEKIEELIETAVSLFGEPYDDRDERSEDAPSLNSVAAEMGITSVKVRRLLITAEYFSTELSRKVLSLHKKGLGIQEIMKETGLGQASVYGYLPYLKGAYKLEEPTLYAEQTRLFRRRKRVCERLEEHLCEQDACEYLWEAILAFENYPFVEECGKRFRYSVSCDQIICQDSVICRSEIEKAFRRARKVQEEKGCVCHSVYLGGCAAEEIYTIFLRVGACVKS